ncbi:MAG: AAA family ATPase [Phycisphaerae bacterium]|nr:AAA family ATPase [Phycisphaerae bacterium]
MIGRHITPRLLAALADTPVVLLHGARQTGKTTLVRALAERDYRARYLTFDDPAVLAVRGRHRLRLRQIGHLASWNRKCLHPTVPPPPRDVCSAKKRSCVRLMTGTASRLALQWHCFGGTSANGRTERCGWCHG